ncbi:putative aldehyde reductase [Aspergillus homomorphus CBS 101889]|uniref:Putative aldehyde reductase n=1 Tax=Aspergillus homomorphus (strain CBS 101889) TaxID=1450537 RepID=A0A395HS48_ASPHC|nr:putative aldehyde reductase [Aspergillus homomorphus CBS 101889]RAL10243.1 putative aldehyde reductase [Aspergillus homomorphus CBS 101889]
MATLNYTLPIDSWVLVTGANGHIASQVIDAFLAKGYRVRGTVRSEKPWLVEGFQAKYGLGRFETAIVPRLEDEGALNGCVQDVAGIVHVASNMSYRPNPSDVIPGVVAATMNVMTAANKTPSVKRVVLTSSVVAAFPVLDDAVGLADKTVDATTWNTAAVADAWNPDTPEHMKPSVIYAAAKVEAERGAWTWMEEHKPHFILNTVLPNMNFGKILFPEHQGSAMRFTRMMLDGNELIMRVARPQWYVDVEDTARLHVVGLLDPNVQSERLFACAAPFAWADVVQILRELQPQNTQIPDALGEVQEKFHVVASARAEQLLRAFYGKDRWTPLKESLAKGIEG